MKTLHAIISLALFVLPGMAFANHPKAVLSGDTIPFIPDTIPAVLRYGNYYYTKWFDDCLNYYPDGGVVDSCF